MTSFAWAEGGAYLIMRSRTDHRDFPDGLAIFASDNVLGTITMCWFDERGISRLCPLTVSERRVQWSHDDPAFRQKAIISANADGRSMTGTGEMSQDGGPWTDDLCQTFERR